MQVRAYIESKIFNVDELLFSKTLEHRNQWWWFSISGSDDLSWAALSLFEAIKVDPTFTDTYLSYNGPYYEKGILQLMQKIDDTFRDA